MIVQPVVEPIDRFTALIIKIKSEEARCLYYSGVQPNTFLWRILHKTFNLNYKTFNEIKIKSVFKQMANVILYALKSTGCRVNVLAIGSAICHATCSMATCAETR